VSRAGNGLSGQLGIGHSRLQHSPYELKKFRRYKVKHIAAGVTHAAAVTGIWALRPAKASQSFMLCLFGRLFV
jgi:hypothetical protein